LNLGLDSRRRQGAAPRHCSPNGRLRNAGCAPLITHTYPILSGVPFSERRSARCSFVLIFSNFAASRSKAKSRLQAGLLRQSHRRHPGGVAPLALDFAPLLSRPQGAQRGRLLPAQDGGHRTAGESSEVAQAVGRPSTTSHQGAQALRQRLMDVIHPAKQTTRLTFAMNFSRVPVRSVINGGMADRRSFFARVAAAGVRARSGPAGRRFAPVHLGGLVDGRR